MLTPRFKLSQDDNHIYIVVHAPYTNLAETEVDIEGNNFLFVSSPYFLRLRLPGKITENENLKNTYTSDTGEFNLIFEKVMPGEHFENLDMITSLLAPKDIPDVNPSLIEVLENDGVIIDDNENPPILDSLTEKYAYGFCNKVSKDFRDIGSEFPQIFELRVPEKVPHKERHKLRVQYESEKFSSDHYLADFYDDELLEPYLSMTIPWKEATYNKDAEFTNDEIAILKELPNKSYLISKKENDQVLLGLVDILFGYCYDKRSTLNDSTVESSWTINRLSATLSWFCTFDDLKQVLISCYRRSLIYPIFRNFYLCDTIKSDLVSLLKAGKKFIVKCLIEIHQMFNLSNDARYILNQLYIKDYLVFIQKCRHEEIQDLAQNIANIEMTKDCLELELIELENAAELVQKDEIDYNLEKQMSSMVISQNGHARDTESDSSSEESDLSDSSTDTDSSDDSSSDDSSSDLDSDDDDEPQERIKE